MDYLKPIFTEKANCQDCYKCVRSCPVKAIKIESQSAMVIYQNCILCGKCVNVCPPKAKKIRNDITKVKQILRHKEKVIISLAPSYISEFDVDVSTIVSAIKKLGFYGVSETALGAEIISESCSEIMNEKRSTQNIFISSTCPSATAYIKKYLPEAAGFVTNLYSPLGAHAKLLKKHFGEDCGVVFVGPCIAKKAEADYNSELIDAVLTFEDLKKWFEDESINLNYFYSDENFIPYESSNGVLYPIENGMNRTIQDLNKNSDFVFMSFSGIENISAAIKDIDKIKVDSPLFIETLACDGGCINGPRAATEFSSVKKKLKILDFYKNKINVKPVNHEISLNEIKKEISIPPINQNNFDKSLIKEILKEIGKINSKDELNCAGCGYDSCNEFAQSLLEGKSEKTMCISYMRQLAQKKANALIKTMPSGVVIVDSKLKIVECNQNFARIMGEEIEMLYDVKPGLEGAHLQRVLPFYKLFENVLETENDIVGKEINYNNSVLLFSIFTIEKNRFVGGIFRDITEPWVQKEQIIKKAKDVIKKNLSTVQKIAFLLGENASETEVILNSIVESFSTNKIDDLNDK